MHLGAGNPSGRPEKLLDTTSTFSLHPTPSYQYLFGRSLYIYMSVTTAFTAAAWRMSLPGLWALTANGPCICDPYRNVAKKQCRMGAETLPSPTMTIIPSTEGGGKMTLFQFFPGGNILSQLFPEGPASSQLAFRWWMWASSLGHWWALAYLLASEGN